MRWNSRTKLYLHRIWSEPHYMFQSQRYLQIAFSILLAADQRPSLLTLAEDISGSNLNRAIRDIPDEETDSRMEAHVQTEFFPQNAISAGKPASSAILFQTVLPNSEIYTPYTAPIPSPKKCIQPIAAAHTAKPNHQRLL